MVLTAHHETVIDGLVSSGRYQNASEVLREGLGLIEEREACEVAKLKALQDAAQAGFADLDQGRYCDLQDADLEEFIAGLGARATDRVRTTRRSASPVYRPSTAAEEDIIQLLAYTQDHFGEAAQWRYEALLLTGLRDLAADPERPGSVGRPEFGPAVRSYHLRHSRHHAPTTQGRVHRPRHLLLYRVAHPDRRRPSSA